MSPVKIRIYLRTIHAIFIIWTDIRYTISEFTQPLIENGPGPFSIGIVKGGGGLLGVSNNLIMGVLPQIGLDD